MAASKVTDGSAGGGKRGQISVPFSIFTAGRDVVLSVDCPLCPNGEMVNPWVVVGTTRARRV